MSWSNRTKPVVTLFAAVVLLIACAPAHAQLRYPFGATGRYTPEGMLIQDVTAGTPCDSVGLQRSDVLLKVDGHLITNQDDFTATINNSGGSVLLIVRKADSGRVVRLTMNLEGKGKGIVAPYHLGVLGNFTPNGLVVKSVGPGTAAAKVGLVQEDVIQRINNQFVGNQLDFFKVLDLSGGRVTLQVRKAATGRVVRLDADLTVYNLGVVGEFTPRGMVVGVVAPGTPAAAIGLMRGDFIARIDNCPIRNQDDFNKAIKNSGGSVVLQVVRSATGEAGLVRVELMNNPLGAWCEPTDDGMRVTAIAAGTPAAGIALSRGDLILKVDETRVKTQRELLAALRESGGLVTLSVRKAATGRVVKLELDLAL